MNYTTKELAKLANVSIRTLHYYDQIKLLKPSRNQLNRYRSYSKDDLLQLQQILFFRELGFPLKEIQKILESKNFNRIEALKDQKQMLKIKRKRLDKLINTITKTISSMNKNSQEQALFEGFTNKEAENYQKEAKERWGKTKAWKQSQEKLKKLTPKELKAIKEEGEQILNEIASHMDKSAQALAVQKAVKKYHHHLGNFYDCSKAMFKKLGQMYSEDLRFTATFEKIKPGLAKFLTAAINIYCEK